MSLNDIIAVDFKTGKVTGKGLDQYWADKHIIGKVKEDETMPKPIDVTKEQFLAAVKQYRSDKTIAQALNIGCSSVYKYRHLYANEIREMFQELKKEAALEAVAALDQAKEEYAPAVSEEFTEPEAKPDIISQPAAEEPDTECPVEPQEISLQCAIEWRDELELDIEKIDMLLDSKSPTWALISFRVRKGLEEIRENFQEQIDQINEVLGKTMVRIGGIE